MVFPRIRIVHGHEFPCNTVCKWVQRANFQIFSRWECRFQPHGGSYTESCQKGNAISSPTAVGANPQIRPGGQHWIPSLALPCWQQPGGSLQILKKKCLGKWLDLAWGTRRDFFFFFSLISILSLYKRLRNIIWTGQAFCLTMLICISLKWLFFFFSVIFLETLHSANSNRSGSGAQPSSNIEVVHFSHLTFSHFTYVGQVLARSSS